MLVQMVGSGAVQQQEVLDVAAAVNAGCWKGPGPVAAAMKGIALLGLGSDPLVWHGTGVVLPWHVLQQSEEATMQLLTEQWYSIELSKVAGRRSGYQHLQAGADRLPL